MWTCKHLALLYRHVYIFLDLILNTKHCNFFVNITACCRAASCRMLFCLIQIRKVHLRDVHGRDCASGLGETEEEWSALWRGGLLPHGHQRALLHQICLWNWSVRNQHHWHLSWLGQPVQAEYNYTRHPCCTAYKLQNKNTAKQQIQWQKQEFHQDKNLFVFCLFFLQDNFWNHHI